MLLGSGLAIKDSYLLNGPLDMSKNTERICVLVYKQMPRRVYKQQGKV